MLITEYLGKDTHQRRILIVSDLNKGQALLRQFEENTGKPVSNITCMTLGQMADKLYLWSLAESGFGSDYEQIDDKEAMMLFQSVLFQNIRSLKYFKVEKMMNLATTREIYTKANLIRKNGWTGAEKPEKEHVSDLKLLISAYEDKLEKVKKLDTVAKYRFVLSEVNKWADVQNELDMLFGAEISFLSEDTGMFTLLDKELLECIVPERDRMVTLYDHELTAEDLRSFMDRAVFFKGYGSFNEANYVANDILKNQYPFGDVTLLYSSQTQLPAITAALRGNGISMNVLSSYPATDNAYVALMSRIIAWAKEDFSEKELDSLLASPVICLELEDAAGDKKNVLGGNNYYRYILNAKNRREDCFVLGWGYERNLDFVDHERKVAETDADKALLDMHEALLNIFGNGRTVYGEKNTVRPIVIYKELLAFMESYTKTSQDYGIGMDVLKSLVGVVGLEERSMSLTDCLQVLEELLAGCTVSDKKTAEAVCVQNLGDWSLLDRKYVYVIGLSLKDMQGNTIESPVLSDSEMETFLGDGYKPTLKAEAGRRVQNLYRTLMSFRGKSIVFGYSSYDTVAFCESNPSSFYREMLKTFSKKDKDLCEFVYGNPVSGTGAGTRPSYTEVTECEIKLMTSSSTLETLLDCPRKYAYDKLLHIPEIDFAEQNYRQWLDAAARGSFFHAIAEQYVSEKLIRPSDRAYESSVDKRFVEGLAKELEREYLSMYPAAFRALADRETEDMIEKSVAYLERLLADYGDDSAHRGSIWRALATEQRFSNAVLPVDDLAGNHYDFTLTGYIDRIDYRISASEQRVYLRIADYKTGKKENKEKDDKLGKLIQYVIYKNALMDSGMVSLSETEDISLLDYVKKRVCELEEDDTKQSWKYVFDNFRYEFPMDETDEEPVVLRESELAGLNMDRLKVILTIITSDKMYPDHLDLYERLEDLAGKYPDDEELLHNLKDKMSKKNKEVISDDEVKYCKYCSYQSLCEHRKEGAF